MTDVASEYEKITEKLKLLKNGIVSEQIQSLGIGYESCLGLSIPSIDQISETLQKNNDLALYCWNQPLREAKLIALRIFTGISSDTEALNAIIKGITNNELSEQASVKLFANFENRYNFALELIQNKNDFVQYAGLVLIRLIAKKNQEIEEKKLIDLLELMLEIDWSDKLHIKRGLAGALLQIGQRTSQLEQKVIIWINNYDYKNQNVTKYIEKEVIYFLETKN